MLRWLQFNRLQTHFASRRAEQVGADEDGNRYFRTPAASGDWRDERRFVVYAGDGAPEPTTVPAAWHGWLHKRTEQPPAHADLPPRRRFETGPVANPTGGPAAHAPGGHPRRGGVRPAATGDYEAWSPDLEPD